MATSIQRPYKVRTSWEDSSTQLGSYAYVDTAKEACIKEFKEGSTGRSGYKVFKDGVCIYNPLDDLDLKISISKEEIYRNIKKHTSPKDCAIEAESSLITTSSVPPVGHYNVVDKEVKPVEEHVSIFQKIKNIFRKK